MKKRHTIIKMKRIKFSATLAMTAAMLICFTAKGQLLNPVKWSYTAKKESVNEATVYIKATIEDGWHIYSLNNLDNGPVRTSFSFVPHKSYQLSGITGEPIPLKKFEKSFGTDVRYFEKSVVFQQKVKVFNTKGIVNGTVEYMACSDRLCLAPETLNFSVNIRL